MPRPDVRLVLLFALSACGGKGQPITVLVGQDSGVVDAGQNNATDGAVSAADGSANIRDASSPPPFDSGVRDSGLGQCGDGFCDQAMGENFINCPRDCPPPAGCVPGAEGCPCNSTWVDGDPSFVQDDCDTGMLCIPWDALSGRQDLTGPVQSCVRPCVRDGECGRNAAGDLRRCVEGSSYNVSSSVGLICVDRVANPDEYCGPSKNPTPRVAGATVYTPNVMVGCEPAAVCSQGLIQELNPDEGVCLQFCGRASDPPCPVDFPYCNPDLFTTSDPGGNPIAIGVCSVGRLGAGAWCRPDLPDRAGLTELCDSAAPGQVLCVGLGLTYGLCMELCDTRATPPAQPCQGIDPTNGQTFCVDEILTNGGGLCMTPQCETFPDTCGGAGTFGHGRSCLPLTQDSEGICVDRRAPVLAPGTLDSTGMLQSAGDDCQQTDMGFTQCPDDTVCLGVQQGTGSCLVGCDRSVSAPPDFCGDALRRLGRPATNATCVDVFQMPGTGLCGGD